MQEVNDLNSVVLEQHLQVAPGLRENLLQVIRADDCCVDGLQVVEEVGADAGLDVTQQLCVGLPHGLTVPALEDAFGAGGPRLQRAFDPG